MSIDRTESGMCPYYNKSNPKCVCKIATTEFASKYSMPLEFLHDNINETSRINDYCIGGKYGNRFSACTYYIMFLSH